jgi:type I restriction enzyme S subunit
MSEWKEILLTDITTKIGDGLHGTPNYDSRGEYYFINGNNLADGKVIIKEETQRVSKEEFKKYSKPLNERTLLLGINGTIGNLAYYRNEKCVLGKSACYINLNDEVDTRFIYYTFLSKHFQNYIEGIATGTTIPNVPLKGIREYSFKLPPPPEQKSIAEVLSSLDDKIDLLHRQNKTLEQLAETLFRQWFVEEAEEGWEKTTFGELVKPRKGRNITKAEAIEGDYPVVAGGLEPSCYHNQSNTSEPVITVSSSGANAGFVRLYHSAIWASDCSYIDNTITPFVFFSYVFLKVNQEILFDKQEGSAQPHVYPSHIMEIEMLNYPKSKIDEFEKKVTSMFQKIKSNTTQIKTLQQLRDTLLPKLMSGEVRVDN